MVECKLLRVREDGAFLVQSKSTENKMLLQRETGLLLPDPIDVGERYFDEVAFEVRYKPKFYTYVETEEYIKLEE